MSEIYVDPNIINNMYSNEDVEDMWYTPQPRTSEIEYMRSIVTKLPEKYRNVYDLVYSRQMSQEEAAKALGVKQPTVSYYLGKITLLLEWHVRLPHITDQEFEGNLNQVTDEYREIFRLYCEYNSYNQVAEELDVKYDTVYTVINRKVNWDIFTPDFREFLNYIKTKPNVLEWRDNATNSV